MDPTSGSLSGALECSSKLTDSVRLMLNRHREVGVSVAVEVGLPRNAPGCCGGFCPRFNRWRQGLGHQQ